MYGSYGVGFFLCFFYLANLGGKSSLIPEQPAPLKFKVAGFLFM